LTDLDGHHGIFHTNRGVGDWRFSGSNGATIVRGRAALLVNNGDMMRDAALAGPGIALLPMFIAGADIKTGRLQVVITFDTGTAHVQTNSERNFIYLHKWSA
jgi:DNA-binding transcriptional LysR family regulator